MATKGQRTFIAIASIGLIMLALFVISGMIKERDRIAELGQRDIQLLQYFDSLAAEDPKMTFPQGDWAPGFVAQVGQHDGHTVPMRPRYLARRPTVAEMEGVLGHGYARNQERPPSLQLLGVELNIWGASVLCVHRVVQLGPQSQGPNPLGGRSFWGPLLPKSRSTAGAECLFARVLLYGHAPLSSLI